jgi:hypothetical protein
LSTCG